MVESEPPTLIGQRRNDLRVRETSSLTVTDYDLKKVYSKKGILSRRPGERDSHFYIFDFILIFI